MQWAGIELDHGRNAGGLTEGRISTDSAAVEVWVADVDEATIMAQDVAQLLG